MNEARLCPPQAVSIEKDSSKPPAYLRDSADRYGWISIALHWITAAFVVALWFTGNTAASGVGDPRMVDYHTSIAVVGYLLLWARIAWRFHSKHPGRLPEQGRIAFALGKYVHLALLVGVGAMLVSGPLIVWSFGGSIAVFDSGHIPSPLPVLPELGSLAHRMHAATGALIGIGILLHLLGVYKHAAFNRDGTFTKMILPWRRRTARAVNEQVSLTAAIKES